MTNGEMIQKAFNCEVCEPIIEDDIIHVIFFDKNDSAIGFDWSWWNAEYKEPTTKNDLGVDCIDRQATLDAIIKRLGIKNETYLLEAERVIYQQILAMPSVTPIRPKGHWICDGKGRSFADYHCSECGLKLALCGQDIKQRQDSGYSLFCGGCGADMREAEE